jgi:hypothetical protein
MIRWTLQTRQDLVSRNLWPKTETMVDIEMTTMPMHQESGSSWNQNKKSTTSWAQSASSPQWKKVPNSITASSYTAISYEITKTTHLLKKPNYKYESKPTNNIRVGTSRVPTYLLVPIMRKLVKPPRIPAP